MIEKTITIYNLFHVQSNITISNKLFEEKNSHFISIL